MASSNIVMAFLATFLVLLPMIACSTIPPILAPVAAQICNEVECGNGTCQVANVSGPATFPFFPWQCACNSGWKRTRLSSEQDYEWLPCIIPQCSLDYSCMPAPPPAPPVPNNSSVFDPCYWMYCGDGTCTKNQTYTRTCQCNPGAYNLLNVPNFPCYSDCALGSDCSKLGVKVSNSTSAPATPPPGNYAASFLPGRFHWVAISLLSIAMAQWK